ncbi:MAG: hypothetical protein GXP06_04815 [Alphaproteobacteria bacterium]|nr:hypothetical protein [Alphaproteobacteria bacterium]
MIIREKRARQSCVNTEQEGARAAICLDNRNTLTGFEIVPLRGVRFSYCVKHRKTLTIREVRNFPSGVVDAPCVPIEDDAKSLSLAGEYVKELTGARGKHYRCLQSCLNEQKYSLAQDPHRWRKITENPHPNNANALCENTTPGGSLAMKPIFGEKLSSRVWGAL